MNLGNNIYSKEFLSTFIPGDLRRDPFHERPQKEIEIIKALISKFSSSQNGSNWRRETYKGFDGTFQYRFSFRVSDLDVGKKEDHLYKSLVIVNKIGSEEDKSKQSDLEEEILKLGFTKI
ncbi:MAG: hypothetical protein ABIB79_00585 [archaeon]